MISQITGTVTQVLEDRVLLTVGGIGYEVLIPPVSRPALAARLNAAEPTTLFTLHYIEGTPGKGNLTPRLVGFVSTTDREFFDLFTTVDGIGVRKALRAMSVPVSQIAVAVERRNAAGLSELPEIGKRTAEKIVAALNGKMERFAHGDGLPTRPGGGAPGRGAARPAFDMSVRFKADALEVLLQLGEKPADAEDLIDRACSARPEISRTEDLLAEVYRIKSARK
jgi:Holliday junction DNA helicase RuvA